MCVLTCLNPPHTGETWTETLAYVLFWGMASVVTAGVILFNGRDFVDAPRLVQKEKMDWECVCGKQLGPVDSSSSSSSSAPSSSSGLSFSRLRRDWSLYWTLSSSPILSRWKRHGGGGGGGEEQGPGGAKQVGVGKTDSKPRPHAALHTAVSSQRNSPDWRRRCSSAQSYTGETTSLWPFDITRTIM